MRKLMILVLLFMPALVFAQDWERVWLTPETLVKKIEIRDADGFSRGDVVSAYLSEDLFFKNRRITLKGDTDWLGSGIKIYTIPVIEDETFELRWLSFVEYDVEIDGGPLGVWREGKNGKQHVWFVFRLVIPVRTDKLMAFLEDMRRNPQREYEGLVNSKFSVRTDKKLIPMEDFESGARTLYVEVLINVEKIDGVSIKLGE